MSIGFSRYTVANISKVRRNHILIMVTLAPGFFFLCSSTFLRVSTTTVRLLYSIL